MTITVRIPDELQNRLQSAWPDLERHALEGLIVEAYRRKMLSGYEVGQALDFKDRWETIRFLSERGAYPNYEAEDFDADMRNLSTLDDNISSIKPSLISVP